ncbi:zinc finger BED domain-containing protein 4-like protein [Lates japonicus]|uniref:Zinc finger BED domain-containing protein 4-like protein n=1 Tax=Lates japonicus TaxID=270547 RepID=A0AAD3RE03_LATJO|nr:zinc finger BED domain-containing protein 4-like protein [Lates japonicus]
MYFIIWGSDPDSQPVGCITVLTPFEEVTRQMSSSTSSVAKLIPSVTVLKWLLTQEKQEDTRIKTMKGNPLEAVQESFRTTKVEP